MVSVVEIVGLLIILLVNIGVAYGVLKLSASVFGLSSGVSITMTMIAAPIVQLILIVILGGAAGLGPNLGGWGAVILLAVLLPLVLGIGIGTQYVEFEGGDVEQVTWPDIVSGTVWMSLLSILLFWLPLLGPLIAGYVGGKKAGNVAGGILSAILPALVVGTLIVLVGAVSGIPIIGAIFASAGILLILIQAFPLIVGGIVGGALA